MYGDIYLKKGIKKVEVELYLEGHEDDGCVDEKTGYFIAKPLIIPHIPMGRFPLNIDPGPPDTEDARMYRAVQEILGLDAVGYFSGDNTFFDYKTSNKIIRQFLANAASIDGRIKGEADSDVKITKIAEKPFELDKIREVYVLENEGKYAVAGGVQSCLRS